MVGDLLRPLLVAVSDRRRLSLPMTEWAKQVLDGGADLIQLREKDLTGTELRPIAVALLGEIDSPRQLQINGFPDLAVELGCGLHLPEAMPDPEDHPRPYSRSIHGAVNLTSALTPDFLIAGHLYSTSSKENIPPHGIDWLRALVQVSLYPIVAIGGIDASNAAYVIRAGAAGIALIGALTDASEPGVRAAEIRTVINREWTQR